MDDYMVDAVSFENTKGKFMIADIAVIGGGTVGAAIAFGLAGRTSRVLLLDGGDRDIRSATANFGLVWAQGKGMDMPAYQRLTRRSIDLWPDFKAELQDVTGIDVQLEKSGGLTLCFGESQFEARRDWLLRLDTQLNSKLHEWEMVDREALEKLMPKVSLGSDVTGASFGRHDGCVNPLRLLSALHRGIVIKGGEIRGECPVSSIIPDGLTGFTIQAGSERISAGRVVIAAGLGSKQLAADLEMDIPIRPNRGQIIVTERVEPFLPLPMSGMRQTREGTVMIGLTHEDVGFDTATTGGAAASLSSGATRRIPAISKLTVVRQWSGLRVMSPDTYPIYTTSDRYPGAFAALCHSGITLASSHASMLAGAIADGRLPPSLDVFHQRRFDVQEAA